MLPTLRQYKKWSLPSKYTFWGLILAAIPIVLLLKDWIVAVPDYAVEQTTTGDKSLNINAPSATSVYISYGIPEEVIKQWLSELKGEKGKEEIIEHLLEDLKDKKVTIEAMQRQIEDGIAMRKELNRRLAEKHPEQLIDRPAPLTKFSHQDFIENFVAFRAYYHYRKTLHLLNPEMLTELLNIYFKSVLLYPSSEQKQYYITASDGRLLRLQLEGRNDRGEKTLVSIPELSPSLLHDVCTDFVKSANRTHYESLLVLFKRALATPELDKMHKANILDAQTFIMKNQLSQN
jgi:hypothetical protein